MQSIFSNNNGAIFEIKHKIYNRNYLSNLWVKEEIKREVTAAAAAAAAKSLQSFPDSATPETTAHQAPPSLGFSR